MSLPLSSPQEPHISTLSVVIPALNEERGIGDTLSRVLAAAEGLRPAAIELAEVVVVDDGSTDQTARIVTGRAGVKLISHGRTCGYGAALKTGFSAATGDLIAFLDADGTYPAEELPVLCRELLRLNADLVVGSRRSGRRTGMPWLRRLGNRIWAGLISLFGHRRVADPASGMRVFRRAVLERLGPLPDGLNFTPIMSTRAVHEGLHLAEYPISYAERLGSSKLSVVKDGTRFLQTIVLTLLEYNPVGIIGSAGLSFLGVGLTLGAVLVGVRLSGTTFLGPAGTFAVYASLVTVVVGVSVCLLAVTFDQLVSLFQLRPVRRGRLARAIAAVAPGRWFGWLGAAVLLLGAGIAAASMVLGLGGWPIERLWLWLVGSAMFVLTGTQLLISWLLQAVLRAIRERNGRTSG